ncbi:MAG: murein L,D-transpeptidase family protein [Bdellovibrionales bacterium]
MKISDLTRNLAFGIGFLLPQFATPFHCFAAEVHQTVSPVVTTAEPAAVDLSDESANDGKPDPIAQTPPEGKLPHALLSLTSETGAFSQYAFLVDKSARTVTVWQNTGDSVKLVGAWPTDIGRRGGDKLVQGDHRTPEGIYFMQTMMDGRKVDFSQYGVRIFTLDYPNYFDRLEKKTGNGIWFHAIPDTKSLLRGSRGCVVVRNKVIEELSRYIDLKRTPMVIVDHVNYLPPDEWKNSKTQLANWLESWRKSWSNKDLEAYMAQYSDRFRGNGMNKKQWRRYKETLNARYDFIEVQLKDIQIYSQGTKTVFRFLQAYKSDRKEDYGAKTLYTLHNGTSYEIVGESWEPYRQTTSVAN